MMSLAYYNFFFDKCGLRYTDLKLPNDQVRRIYPLSKSLPGSAWICMGAASDRLFLIVARHGKEQRPETVTSTMATTSKL